MRPKCRMPGLLLSQTTRVRRGPSKILCVSDRTARPGPKKVKRLPIGSRRTCTLLQSVDYTWRELLERADVVSEGAIRKELDGPVYYGSTSVLLMPSESGPKYSDSDLDNLAKLLTADPHARVRAVRIACLEAQLRAGCDIGAVRAELTIRRDTKGVRLDIDVEARIVGVTQLPQTKSGT